MGVLIIFWLSVEDTTTNPAILLAIPASALLTMHFYFAAPYRSLPVVAGIGLLGGLTVSPIAAGLMLVKIGLHGHGNVPDFTFADFEQVFERAFFFGAAGLLIASGLRLYTSD